MGHSCDWKYEEGFQFGDQWRSHLRSGNRERLWRLGETSTPYPLLHYRGKLRLAKVVAVKWRRGGADTAKRGLTLGQTPLKFLALLGGYEDFVGGLGSSRLSSGGGILVNDASLSGFVQSLHRGNQSSLHGGSVGSSSGDSLDLLNVGLEGCLGALVADGALGCSPQILLT